MSGQRYKTCYDIFYRKAAKKEEERIKKLRKKIEIDSYAECYPG